VALAVHRAEIEELVAEWVALLILREDVLQCLGKFAKAERFRPLAITLFVFDQRYVGEQAAAASRTFLKAGEQLIGISPAE
jgi:hypothetical protein